MTSKKFTLNSRKSHFFGSSKPSNSCSTHVMSKVCSASMSCYIDVVQCFHDCACEEYDALSDSTPVFDFGGDIAKAEETTDQGYHCRWGYNIINGKLSLSKLNTRRELLRVCVNIHFTRMFALCLLTMCRFVVVFSLFCNYYWCLVNLFVLSCLS